MLPGRPAIFSRVSWHRSRRRRTRQVRRQGAGGRLVGQAERDRQEGGIAEAVRLAQRAIELGKDDALALGCGGWTLAHVASDLDAGAAFIERALVLNPNLAAARLFSGKFAEALRKAGLPECSLLHSRVQGHQRA